MLVVVADGEPLDPLTNSGVAAGLSRALANTVARTTFLSGRSRSVVVRNAPALISDPKHAREIIRFSGTSVRARSHAVRRRIPSSSSHVLYVRNVWIPPKHLSYSSYIDATGAQKRDEWPSWGGHVIDTTERLRLERHFYLNAEFVFAASHDAIRSLVVDYGVSSDRAVLVGSGLDVHGQRSPVRRATGSGLSILFVGTDFQRKGGPSLLRAFAGLQDDATLTIVGPPIGVAHQPGVIETGPLPPESLSRLYGLADIFVLPSEHEPYGRSVLEAMWHGVPAVVSNVGELPYLVDSPKRGLCVSVGDDSALRHALRQLIGDAQLRASMGQAGQEFAQTQTWDRVAKLLVAHWNSRQIPL